MSSLFDLLPQDILRLFVDYMPDEKFMILCDEYKRIDVLVCRDSRYFIRKHLNDFQGEELPPGDIRRDPYYGFNSYFDRRVISRILKSATTDMQKMLDVAFFKNGYLFEEFGYPLVRKVAQSYGFGALMDKTIINYLEESAKYLDDVSLEYMKEIRDEFDISFNLPDENSTGPEEFSFRF